MTGAGVRLFDRFKPAITEMEAAVIDVHEASAAPTGLVSLHIPRAAYAGLLEGRLGELHRRYPRIHLDTVVDDAVIDIVRGGFDLDLRLSGALDASIGGSYRRSGSARRGGITDLSCRIWDARDTGGSR